ncbi:hypothetical protein A6A27_24620 [Micromonospora sp. CB01531]|nr:hypothetical protein [Micromonospora sp. CB01531]OKI65561.1 hypothetical protein A6A27_24620 [Micromonospora sp. CB01531]
MIAMAWLLPREDGADVVAGMVLVPEGVVDEPVDGLGQAGPGRGLVWRRVARMDRALMMSARRSGQAMVDMRLPVRLLRG